MPYTPILGTLGYILSPDRKKVLLVQRTRKNDYSLGKYNGLGGKLEPGEDIVTGMKREIREEAGIECTELTLRGTINWTGFGPNKEDWFGFIFIISAFEGTPYEKNIEGNLEWVEIGRMESLPMWEGDKYFLPLLFDQKPPFHGYMPYEGGRPLSWSVCRI